MYARGIQLLNFGSIYIETPMLRHFLALLSRLLLSIRYRLFFFYSTRLVNSLCIQMKERSN